jgi:hypothetical protein
MGLNLNTIFAAMKILGLLSALTIGFTFALPGEAKNPSTCRLQIGLHDSPAVASGSTIRDWGIPSRLDNGLSRGFGNCNLLGVPTAGESKGELVFASQASGPQGLVTGDTPGDSPGDSPTGQSTFLRQPISRQLFEQTAIPVNLRVGPNKGIVENALTPATAYILPVTMLLTHMPRDGSTPTFGRRLVSAFVSATSPLYRYHLAATVYLSCLVSAIKHLALRWQNFVWQSNKEPPMADTRSANGSLKARILRKLYEAAKTGICTFLSLTGRLLSGTLGPVLDWQHFSEIGYFAFSDSAASDVANATSSQLCSSLEERGMRRTCQRRTLASLTPAAPHRVSPMMSSWKRRTVQGKPWGSGLRFMFMLPTV